MDVIYRLGRATATEVHGALPNPPTYTTVRGLLRVLEEKGHVRHAEQGRQYLYEPSTPREDAGASHLAHVLRTFFGGSPAAAMAALLGSQQHGISPEELGRLAGLVERARRVRKT